MHITNAQMKAIIDMYTGVKRAQKGPILMSDICNIQTINRFEKVLNDLLHDKIKENNANNELFIQARKELKHYAK